MAKIQETRSFEGKSANDCYNAGLKAYPAAGFNVWKERSLAWLLMAKKKDKGVDVDSNLSARPTSPAQVTLGLSSDAHTEEELTVMAEQIFSALQQVLG